jgi:hypothetical protein
MITGITRAGCKRIATIGDGGQGRRSCVGTEVGLGTRGASRPGRGQKLRPESRVLRSEHSRYLSRASYQL